MRVLFDTNVVLDVVLQRPLHFRDSAATFSRAEEGLITGVLGATSVTTVHYFCTRALGPTRAISVLEDLFAIFEVARVDGHTLRKALTGGLADYEDAVLHEAALEAGAEAIVTRDAAGFAAARIPVFSPETLLAAIATIEKGQS
ncbi:MAG: PIN domain-containing protein [Coriobacteriia bacterium]|nr:PIN domain-containing protein [Coriobacteriia bacterium]